MKRTLFRALGLVELFSFLLFFTPSALAATVSAKWVVLADQHQVQPQVMLKFTLSAPATVTILYQIDPFCGCGIAGWNYFSVEHRPKGSPGDTGWDSDPSHYGPYRAFVSDTTKDLTPSSGDGQLDKSQEVMVGSDGSQAFEYRIVGHPKIVVHANSTPAVTLTVQVSTSTNVLTGSAVGPATGGATVATTTTTTSTSGVEDCVNNRMWTVTANGAPAGTYYFKSDGTVQGIVGTTDFDIFPGIIFVLFVTIWSIRTVSGAFLAALTYVVLNQVWPSSVGIFAGIGIILIGRAANGILGIEALHFRLPWVKGGGQVAIGEPTPPARVRTTRWRWPCTA